MIVSEGLNLPKPRDVKMREARVLPSSPQETDWGCYQANTLPQPKEPFDMENLPDHAFDQLSRRSLLASAAVTTAILATGSEKMNASQTPKESVPGDFRVANKRIRQSVMGWCFNPMPVPELIDHCVKIGIEAIEGVDSKFYPLALEKGLKIALVGSHGFAKGPTDKANHPECVAKLIKGIDIAVESKAPSVITFTGMRVAEMSDATAEKNCLDCWKDVIRHAEKNKITIVLEHLNSRDSSHPMKGHPGYFGDDVERCFELVKRMDSPYFKLLFDIYHVQIMNGCGFRKLPMTMQIESLEELDQARALAQAETQKVIDDNEEPSIPQPFAYRRKHFLCCIRDAYL